MLLNLGILVLVDASGQRELPESVNEYEFVLAMSLNLGILEWEQVQPFMKQFRILDADGSGHLTRNDLKVQMAATQVRLAQKQAEVEQLARGRGRRKLPTVAPELSNMMSDAQHNTGACGEAGTCSVSSTQPLPPGRSCASQ